MDEAADTKLTFTVAKYTTTATGVNSNSALVTAAFDAVIHIESFCFKRENKITMHLPVGGNADTDFGGIKIFHFKFFADPGVGVCPGSYFYCKEHTTEYTVNHPFEHHHSGPTPSLVPYNPFRIAP